jgi:sulfate adenylyltransferase/3'-phosphoadenosine 5'-phosphosulfate synthase
VQQGFVIWLTGLSGAGKTTISHELVTRLRAQGQPVEVLDGDVVRENLSKGLGFSREDRDTNIRRIAFVASLLSRNGVAVIVAAISPYREVRDEARQIIGSFLEVYVKCSMDELVRRDTKGLYARALRGEIPNFTGVSDPYEPPLAPEVTAETDLESVDDSVGKILRALQARGYLKTVPAASSTALQGGLSTLIPPHGGMLVHRMVPAEEQDAWLGSTRELPSLVLTPRQISDVEMIAIGGFSPLTGFMGSADYRAVVEGMHLESGLVWPIPISLAVSAEEAERLPLDRPVALRDAEGDFLAILHVQEKFVADTRREAQHVYRTTDEAHPGVKALYEQGEVRLAGPVTLIRRSPSAFEQFRIDPADTRALFAERGWRRVVGFQTRNPVHRAHEYIQKVALEMADGLLLHPLVGETKGDDVPADVRMRCYEVLLQHYYPSDRTVLAINPAAMRYAGPREAVFHALIRQNYGCSYFIVGRDHAGVGNYYGTFDAHHIFDEFQPGEIGITPLFFDHTYYCQACTAIVSVKTCPHDKSQHLTLSGTQVRALLRNGEPLPLEFTRPEVAAVLAESMEAEAASMAGPAVGRNGHTPQAG